MERCTQRREMTTQSDQILTAVKHQSTTEAGYYIDKATAKIKHFDRLSINRCYQRHDVNDNTV